MGQPACSNNPVLDPDAWFELSNGRPAGRGLEAILVCRFACPVRLKGGCPVTDDQDVIADGGWYNNKGLFHKSSEDVIDIHQAAVYIGIGVERLRTIVKRRGMEKPNSGFYSTIYVSDMKKLANAYSPPHGSWKMARLHHIRGEPSCNFCKAAWLLEQPQAQIPTQRRKVHAGVR